MNVIMAYSASGILFIWGISHAMQWKSVIRNFGAFENRLVIAMEWIAEGLTIIFIGLICFMTAFFAGIADPAAILVRHISSGMLAVLAVLSFFTGARVKMFFLQLCPFVKLVCAGLLIFS